LSRGHAAFVMLIALVACDPGVTAPLPDFAEPHAFAGSDLGVRTDPCPGERESTADEVEVGPDRDHRSIQEAICVVEDGGTIVVRPGVYEERITIQGKHVNIRGSGVEATWPVLSAPPPAGVVAAGDVNAIITIGSEGSASLKMLRLAGGDAGIAIASTGGAVEVKHVRFEDNGRGILSYSPAELAVKHSHFSGQLWNGISYVPVAPFDLTEQNCGGLQVSHGVFGFVGNAGIYVRGCWHTIEHTQINSAQGGGIVSIASILHVTHVTITFSTYFGVMLVNTHGVIDHSLIWATSSGSNGILGDAITVWSTDASWAQGGPKPSYVQLKSNSTYYSDRAALSVFGGTVSLKNNTFWYQSFDFQADSFDGYTATFVDLGGSRCLPLDPDDRCLAKSYELEPPPPVGGFE
jgi:hypothetical protein